MKYRDQQENWQVILLRAGRASATVRFWATHRRLWGANSQSSGDRRLEETATVPCLVIFGEVRTRWRWTAGTLYGRRAVERAMNASIVVIGAELTELPAQIDRMPEERLIQIVAADRPDQSLDVRVRHRSVRHRLDFFDFEDPQIREPSMKAEQGIVIRAESNGRCFAADGLIEHPRSVQ